MSSESANFYIAQLSHGKLSNTIGLHQKNSQDASVCSMTGIAQVVKTSNAFIPNQNDSKSKLENQLTSNSNNNST